MTMNAPRCLRDGTCKAGLAWADTECVLPHSTAPCLGYTWLGVHGHLPELGKQPTELVFEYSFFLLCLLYTEKTRK